MARKFKTIKLNIEFQIYDDEKEILDKYGFDYIRNSEEAAKDKAKIIAYTLKYCEEMQKNSNKLHLRPEAEQ